MNKEEAFNVGLPKWPQCVINGEKITEEQALEIIRRTDRFFFGYDGNNREFNKKAKEILHVVDFEDYRSEDFHIAWEEYTKAKEEFDKVWGLVDTEYLHNSWISCCWVGGYHGWCHPDGTIGYCNNIGKWPSVEDVYNDLCMLGKEFPFLNLTCTLMNKEESEPDIDSLVSMWLHDGEVEFIDTIPVKEIKITGITFGLRMGRENYFTLDQLQEMADKVYAQNVE